MSKNLTEPRHPVTEEVTGVDLVEWQLSVSASISIRRNATEPRSPRETHCLSPRSKYPASATHSKLESMLSDLSRESNLTCRWGLTKT